MRQEVPAPCTCCGEYLDDGDFFSRDTDGRLFCLACYDMTAPRTWDGKQGKWRYAEPPAPRPMNKEK